RPLAKGEPHEVPYRILRGVKLSTRGHQFGGRDQEEAERRHGADQGRQGCLQGLAGRPAALFQERRRPLSQARGDLREGERRVLGPGVFTWWPKSRRSSPEAAAR